MEDDETEDCYELFVYILSSNSKTVNSKIRNKSNMMKFLSKFRKTGTQTYIVNNTVLYQGFSVFVSIDSSSSSSVFVDVFKLFPSYSLGGHFFDQANKEVFETKLFGMYCSGMHGKSRFFPFFFVETASVMICPLVGFLNCPSKVTILVITQFALPQIYDVSRLAIK